jgi:hypothetical protein
VPADAQYAQVLGKLLAPFVRADSDDVPGSEDNKEEDGKEVKVGHQSKDEADHTSGNEDHIKDEREDQQALNAESQAQGIASIPSNDPGGPEDGNIDKRKQGDGEEGGPESIRSISMKR